MARNEYRESLNDSDDFANDSLTISDALPEYNRDVDRSRSFLDRQVEINVHRNGQSNSLRDAVLRRTLEPQKKDSNAVSTPKRTVNKLAKFMDISPIPKLNISQQQFKDTSLLLKGDDSSILIDEDGSDISLAEAVQIEDLESSLEESLAAISLADTRSLESPEKDVVLVKSRPIQPTELRSTIGPKRTAYIVSSDESSSESEGIDESSNKREEITSIEEVSTGSEVPSDDSERSKVNSAVLSDSNTQKRIGQSKNEIITVLSSESDEMLPNAEGSKCMATSNHEDSSDIIILLESNSNDQRISPQVSKKTEVADQASAKDGLQKSMKPVTKNLDLYIVKEARFKGPQVIPAPHLKPEQYKMLVSSKPVQRLFGGKMTTERKDVARAVTGDVISKMHNSVAGAPSEKESMPTPKGLSTELLAHQKYGLAWMLWREKQSPPGGILADDMGLGKTLSFLALIVEQLNRRTDKSEEEIKLKNRAICASLLIPSSSTLVIVPASLIYQWEAEVEKHVKSGVLNVHIFHGPKQKREWDPKRLARYDVVLTTYSTVTSELSEKQIIDDGASTSDDDLMPNHRIVKPKTKGKRTCNAKGSVLTKVAWERIILDEAHQIKNKTSLVSKACCRLPGMARWCSSGTPVHNKLWDLFSLMRFLRVSPFDEEAVWKEYIMQGSPTASDRLNTLVKGLLLRREKTNINALTGRPIVELQEKKHEDIILELVGLEKKVYEIMFLASRQKVKEMIEQNASGGVKRFPKWKECAKIRNPFLGGAREINLADNFQAMSSVLTMLLRLRQASVHLALTKNAVDMEAFDNLDFGDDKDEQLTSLTENLANLSVVDQKAIEAEILADKINDDVSALFEPSYDSTKVRALLSRLDQILAIGDKCVVVSQWTSLLEIIEQRLIDRAIDYTTITGKVLPKNRQSCVDTFNKQQGGAKVMLLSLTAGGVGLNLMGGNHLFLLDLHWNPAIEQQACDRIYRMGQKKNVFVHKFICNETIEQRVLDLQEKKKALAKSVLEGAASKKLGKLTINDIKFLFDLNPALRKPVGGNVSTNQAASNMGNVPPKFLPASSLLNNVAR